jgi:hypothetical protein
MAELTPPTYIPDGSPERSLTPEEQQLHSGFNPSPIPDNDAEDPQANVNPSPNEILNQAPYQQDYTPGLSDNAIQPNNDINSAQPAIEQQNNLQNNPAEAANTQHTEPAGSPPATSSTPQDDMAANNDNSNTLPQSPVMPTDMLEPEPESKNIFSRILDSIKDFFKNLFGFNEQPENPAAQQDTTMHASQFTDLIGDGANQSRFQVEGANAKIDAEIRDKAAAETKAEYTSQQKPPNP